MLYECVRFFAREVTENTNRAPAEKWDNALGRRPRTKMLLVGMLSLIMFAFTIAAWELWRMPEEQPMFAENPLPAMHLSLWESNQPIVILCFLLLAPVSIGALLMVRQRN